MDGLYWSVSRGNEVCMALMYMLCILGLPHCRSAFKACKRCVS